MAEPAFTFTDQIRPVCEIGMSDVREAEPDEWLDVSCYVHEVEIFRGRERFSDRFMPATASITFDNRSGWGDLVGAPLIVAGQTLRPARPIRVGVSGVFDDDTVESTRWLYRGWIDQATPAYDPVLHDVVTVNCIDAFGEAGQSVAPTGPEQGVNETVSARVNRALDAVGWFPAKRKVATVATTVQGTPLGSRAVDLMTAAADSAGGVVFGDLDGDVVLKGIDWMLYDPDTPHDGEIGNMDPGDPVLIDLPPYVNPIPGPVYDPAPPPMVRPPIVQICVPEGTPNGTIVEQGDSWRIYVYNGHLYYESSGRTWDMGAFTGEGCSTIYPPDDDEPPEIVDECPEGMVWDPETEGCTGEPVCPEGFVFDWNLVECVEIPPGEECPEGMEWVWNTDSSGGACEDVVPVPPPDVPGPGPGPPRPPREPGEPVDPTTLFTVELLGWDDRGFDELPTTRIDPITVTPGTDCLLVVLVNALSTISNTALLAPVVTGGSLDWFHHRHADQAGDGAASFIMMAQVGRDDPGTFDVGVDWASPATTRSHIATVWKVRNAVNDYVDKFDAGLVLYATIDSNPPEEAQPGDGPQTVTMVADDPPVGFPALPRAVDITIAQSLAEESTGPFGAVFDESNGPWNYPSNAPAQPAPALLDALWLDEFERVDGPLGDDWIFGEPLWYYIGVNQLVIEDGAAIGTVPNYVSLEGPFLNSMRWADPQGPDQTVEVVVENVYPNGSVQLYAHGNDDDDKSCHVAQFYFSTLGEDVVAIWLSEVNDVDEVGSSYASVPRGTTEPVTCRLEADGDGTLRAYVDGVLALTWTSPNTIPIGPRVGIGIEYGPSMDPGDGIIEGSPRILTVGGGSTAVRKTSWVAAWRQGVTYADVVLDDVNLGVDDVQSAQACIVIESAEVEDFPTTPYGPITIGGATDPYNGPIDYIALFDPVTGEPILRFP